MAKFRKGSLEARILDESFDVKVAIIWLSNILPVQRQFYERIVELFPNNPGDFEYLLYNAMTTLRNDAGGKPHLLSGILKFAKTKQGDNPV